MLVTLPACSRKPAATEEAGVEPVAVIVEVTRLLTLRSTINGNGIVVPAAAGDWTIYAPETGRIDELPKAEGAEVKPGDVLVRFEFGNTSADLSAREGDLAAANARLGTAQQQLARVSSMFDRGYASRAELDTAKNAVALAELDITRIKQQLQTAKDAADRAVIKARFAGIVAKRYHNEGDLVTASMTDPVLRVVDPQRVQVAMSIPVQDLAQIQAGQTATVLSASGVAPVAVFARPTPTDPQATLQEIRLAFAGPTTLALDSPVQVEILLAERAGVIALPGTAILKTADGSPFVMVAGDDGRAHRRDVRLGLITRERSEITTGLSPGERVIVKAPSGALDGMPVVADR